MSMHIAAIVLAGGESRRMGRAKADLPFGGETMLERIVRTSLRVARPVAVVAAAEQTLLRLPDDVMIVRDPVPGRGPWQGIAAGLRALADVDVVYVAGCDGPFLEPDWIRRLADLIGACDCAVPFVDDRWQPLAALYRPRVAPAIERLLDANARPLSLFDLVPTRRVLADELRDIDPELRTLRNINTQDEYQDALRTLDLAQNALNGKDDRKA